MANTEASARTSSADAARPTSVLVVEDDNDIRDAIADLLRDEGYAVDVAGNGQEALAILRGGVSPSLIVLDLMMPVMNGWQFREEQAADPRLASMPVVIISADAAAAREALSLGVAAFLQKPIELEELLGIIARYCPRPPLVR